MAKSPDAFRTISEVADWLGIQAHVLRFWESKFTQVKPIKRAGGRRYYRPSDMLLLGGIKKLLHEDGMTIKGVQKILREEGMSFVADKSEPLDEQTLTQIEAEPETPAALPPEPAEKGVVLAFAPPAAAADAHEEAQAKEDAPQEGTAGRSDSTEDTAAPDLTEDAPNPVEQVMQDHAAIQKDALAEDSDLPEQQPDRAAMEDAPLPAAPFDDDGEMPIEATASTPVPQAPEAEPQEPTPVDAVMDTPAEAPDRLPDAVDDDTQPVPAPESEAEPVEATDLLSLTNAEEDTADLPGAESEGETPEAVAAPTEADDSPREHTADPLDSPPPEDDTPSLPGFIQTPLAADDSLPAVDAPMARGNPPPDAAPARQTPAAVEEAAEQPAFFDTVDSPSPTKPEAELESGAAEHDGPRPRIIDVPPLPTESELHVMPSALTFATRFPNITPSKAAAIRPLLDQLTALRDSMAGRRGDGPPPDQPG